MRNLVLVMIFLIGCATALQTNEETYYSVKRVVNGDTIDLAGIGRVQLCGIDAPELAYQDKPAQKGAEQAMKRLLGMLEGKKVRLVLDQVKTDKYGRTLAYVYTEDGKFVNEAMVDSGWAVTWNIPPNEKHKDDLKAAEERAKKKGLGLWGDGQELPPLDPTNETARIDLGTIPAKAKDSGESYAVKRLCEMARLLPKAKSLEVAWSRNGADDSLIQCRAKFERTSEVLIADFGETEAIRYLSVDNEKLEQLGREESQSFADLKAKGCKAERVKKQP